MSPKLNAIVMVGVLCQVAPAMATPAHAPSSDPRLVLVQDISRRPSDYSNGYGTNAANSEAVGAPINQYGGYVVNQYGFGNYVSGPQGFGGYPAGSAGAEIWRQRERWKCQNAPESC